MTLSTVCGVLLLLRRLDSTRELPDSNTSIFSLVSKARSKLALSNLCIRYLYMCNMRCNLLDEVFTLFTNRAPMNHSFISIFAASSTSVN